MGTGLSVFSVHADNLLVLVGISVVFTAVPVLVVATVVENASEIESDCLCSSRPAFTVGKFENP